VLTLAELQSAYDEAEQSGSETFILRRALGYLQAQSASCSSCTLDRTRAAVKYVLPCYCTLCSECCDKLRQPSQNPQACKAHSIPFPPTLLATIAQAQSEKKAMEKLRAISKQNPLSQASERPPGTSERSPFLIMCCACPPGKVPNAGVALANARYSKFICQACLKGYIQTSGLIGH
jgi:hypothetical protein